MSKKAGKTEELSIERKPTLFIGSSAESLNEAFALQSNLEHYAEVTVWPQGVFTPSRTTIHNLTEAMKQFDFAAFIFTPDDITTLRDERYRTTRDNVIFELGLFVGHLSMEKCFIVTPRDAEDMHLPTDLAGITPVQYTSKRSDGNMEAALGPASNQIRQILEDKNIQNQTSSVQKTLPTFGDAPEGSTLGEIRKNTDKSIAWRFNYLLTNNTWRLTYNPAMNQSKRITFDSDGNVVVGSNSNERFWRIANNQTLELVQSDGNVHSRFSWNFENHTFIDTQDSDVAKKIQGQSLSLEGITVVHLDGTTTNKLNLNMMSNFVLKSLHDCFRSSSEGDKKTTTIPMIESDT